MNGEEREAVGSKLLVFRGVGTIKGPLPGVEYICR